MTCAEFRELAALYALEALPDEERAAADAHLREPGHEGCLEALREAVRGMEGVALSLPPARADGRIWGGIEQALERTNRPAPRWREATAWALAAAILVFALFNAFHERSLRQRELAAVAREKQQCVEALRNESDLEKTALSLLQSPTSKLLSLNAPSGAARTHAVALVDPNARRGVVLSTTLAGNPDRDYQLWVIRGNDPPKPGALLHKAASGTLVAQIDPSLLAAGVDAIALSLEPKGGSPNGKPTEVLAVGAMPRT